MQFKVFRQFFDSITRQYSLEEGTEFASAGTSIQYDNTTITHLNVQQCELPPGFYFL